MVNLPWQRDNLIYYLEILSDKAKQQQRWVEHIYPPGVVYDHLDYCIHFLYDDTALADDPEVTLGDILVNQDEANQVRSLIGTFEIVFDKLGMTKTDEEYINSPEWQGVVEAASRLLKFIKENNSS
jgi:hypothetical protein